MYTINNIVCLIFQPCEPSMSKCTLTDKKFGVEYIANPRKKVDPLTIKLLIENPQNQYNFVCNVLMEVCGVSIGIIIIISFLNRSFAWYISETDF